MSFVSFCVVVSKLREKNSYQIPKELSYQWMHWTGSISFYLNILYNIDVGGSQVYVPSFSKNGILNKCFQTINTIM